MNTSNMLETFARLCDEGMNAKNTVKVFKMIGIDGYDEKAIDSFVLWSDCLPVSDDMPYTPEQRNLHILWESIDRVPLGINVAFAIPFRQIIAKHLFKKCGDGFIANEGCRFNYGHQNIYPFSFGIRPHRPLLCSRRYRRARQGLYKLHRFARRHYRKRRNSCHRKRGDKERRRLHAGGGNSRKTRQTEKNGRQRVF